MANAKTAEILDDKSVTALPERHIFLDVAELARVWIFSLIFQSLATSATFQIQPREV